MIYRYLLVPYYEYRLLDRTKKHVWPRVNDTLFPAILRTNKQIYDEASELMYSELVPVLHPGGIVCLRPRPNRPHFQRSPDYLCWPSKRVWRHNPLHGIGIGTRGGRIYNTPEMDGKMEPHVFSKFKNIRVSMELVFFQEDFEECPELFILPDLTIMPESCFDLGNFLRRTNIFRDLADILSNTPRLRTLYILLYIVAQANWDDSLGYDHTDSSDLCVPPDKRWFAVDTKAAEIFIESGIMDPLRKLTNVDLAIIDAYSAWGDLMLPQKVAKLRKRLEDDIEKGHFDPSDSSYDILKRALFVTEKGYMGLGLLTWKEA
jgi:hypothetical protein